MAASIPVVYLDSSPSPYWRGSGVGEVFRRHGKDSALIAPSVVKKNRAFTPLRELQATI